MIRVTSIAFDKNQEPDEISLVIDVETAAWLAMHVGKLSPAATVPPEASPACSELYDCLTGSVFNPYFDAGVDDYLRGRP